MYIKFREIGTHGFWDMQACRNTDRHTNHNTLPIYWGKAIKVSDSKFTNTS